ncbi:hypothetical protein D3C81_2213310 [compost metagenome]
METSDWNWMRLVTVLGCESARCAGDAGIIGAHAAMETTATIEKTKRTSLII